MIYTVTPGSAEANMIESNDRVSEILQNISVILTTRQGSVPMYREFGLPMKFLDKPVSVAKGIMIAEVQEAIAEFEPNATFLGATFAIDVNNPGKLIPTVEVRINEQ